MSGWSSQYGFPVENLSLIGLLATTGGTMSVTGPHCAQKRPFQRKSQLCRLRGVVPFLGAFLGAVPPDHAQFAGHVYECRPTPSCSNVIVINLPMEPSRRVSVPAFDERRIS